MEEYTQDQVAQAGPPQASGFSSSKSKNSSSKWLLIFIALLVLGGAGIFFFTKSANEAIPTPTPSFGVMPVDEETSTPAPTRTPEPAKKSEVSIEIQNGTGITGEAKLLQDKLKALGYSDFTVGNASTTDHTDTTVTFVKTLSQSTQDEIKKELESFYKKVVVKTVTTQSKDVLIVTGLRNSQTSRPSSTSSPRASGSATPRASSTPSASPAN